MDNLNELKELWHNADTGGLPKSNEMLQLVKKYRNQKLRKITALVIGALLLTALMICVGLIYKSVMVTTRIGEVLMIIAGFILFATNINSLNRFYLLNDLSNKEFIEFLKHTRVRQKLYHTKTQVVALAFCSAGLLLYLFELVYNRPVWLIVVYGITIAYILIVWLVVRPWVYKKQSRKMAETISKFEKISNQLKNDE